jgi:hypothetical protein
MIRLERFLKYLCLIEAIALCSTLGVYVTRPHRAQPPPPRPVANPQTVSSLPQASADPAPALDPATDPLADMAAQLNEGVAEPTRRTSAPPVAGDQQTLASPTATAAGRSVRRTPRPAASPKALELPRTTKPKPAVATDSLAGDSGTGREEPAESSSGPSPTPSLILSGPPSPPPDYTSQEAARETSSRPPKGRRVWRTLKKVGKFLIR